MTGVKFDSGKIRMELLPPELLEETAKVLTFGANKYADRNWELGMKWSRVYGALMRHLWAWWNPFVSDKDPETGYSHLAHAACCIAFLISYESRGVGEDDRPSATKKSPDEEGLIEIPDNARYIKLSQAGPTESEDQWRDFTHYNDLPVDLKYVEVEYSDRTVRKQHTFNVDWWSGDIRSYRPLTYEEFLKGEK